MLPPPPKHTRCCNRAAAVALYTAAALRAAATAADAAAAAVPPPCFRRRRAGALPVLLTLAIVVRPREDDAGENAFIVTMFLLLIYSLVGWYYVGRLAGWQPYLKAFEAKAERSKSWLRDRAMEKLALYSGGGVDGKAGAAAEEWASCSSQSGVGNSTVINHRDRYRQYS